MPKDAFLAVGQYHEGLMGGEDCNMLWRLETRFRKYNCPGIMRFPTSAGAIRNTLEDSSRLMDPARLDAWRKDREAFKRDTNIPQPRQWIGDLWRGRHALTTNICL
jgi:hypothetical protein